MPERPGFRAPVLAVPDVGLSDSDAVASAASRLRASWIGILAGVPLGASIGVLAQLDAPMRSRLFVEVAGENQDDAQTCLNIVESLLTPLVSLGDWVPALPHALPMEVAPYRPAQRVGLSRPGSWPSEPIDWAGILGRLAPGPGVLSISVTCIATQVSPAVAAAAGRRLARRERRGAVAGPPRDPTPDPQLQGHGETSVLTHMSIDGDTAKANQFVSLLQDACTSGGARVSIRQTPLPKVSSPNHLIDAVAAGRVMSTDQASILLPLPVTDSSVALPIARRHLSAGQYAVPPRGAALSLGVSDNGSPYQIPVDDLAQHLLVTGLQGYGKSTTIKTLLTQLWDDHAIPFLVVDPLKDDYFTLSLGRSLSDGSVSPRVLEIGGEGGPFNPLAVPDGVDPGSFAGVLADCYDGVQGLSLTFPLGMSVMRKALGNVYDDWDQTLEGAGWPTLAHLYAQVQREISATVRGETAQALRASLPTRLEALVSGTGGDALTGGPRSGLPWSQITSEPTVISLRRFADSTSREICFSFVLAGLMAYRRVHGLGGSQHAVQHVAVLEEAHMVLKSGDNARAVAEALATQRAMGQSYVLATQSPSQLPGLVYELFPSRVSHRLAGGDGASQVAGAMGLPEPTPLLALTRGEVLALNANGYSSPVRVRVTPVDRTTAHASFWPVLQVDPPERYWCERCPRPCIGREWMVGLPSILGPLLSETEYLRAGLEDQALQMARLLLRARQESSPGSFASTDVVRAGLYCGVARGLTLIHSADARQCHLSQDAARRVADGTANALARARERKADS